MYVSVKIKTEIDESAPPERVTDQTFSSPTSEAHVDPPLAGVEKIIKTEVETILPKSLMSVYCLRPFSFGNGCTPPVYNRREPKLEEIPPLMVIPALMAIPAEPRNLATKEAARGQIVKRSTGGSPSHNQPYAHLSETETKLRLIKLENQALHEKLKELVIRKQQEDAIKVQQTLMENSVIKKKIKNKARSLRKKQKKFERKGPHLPEKPTKLPTPSPERTLLGTQNTQALPQMRITIPGQKAPVRTLLPTPNLGQTLVPIPTPGKTLFPTSTQPQAVLPHPFSELPQLRITIRRQPVLPTATPRRTLLPTPKLEQPLVPTPMPGKTTLFPTPTQGRAVLPHPTSALPQLRITIPGQSLLSTPSSGRKTLLPTPIPGRNPPMLLSPPINQVKVSSARNYHGGLPEGRMYHPPSDTTFVHQRLGPPVRTIDGKPLNSRYNMPLGPIIL